MAITASMVKELREKTGAGMMDCKKALTECDGDMAKAIDWLREKGIAKAAKKSGRIAAEGLSKVVADGNVAVLVEMNSETDFVAKNEQFLAVLDTVARTILANQPTDLETALALTTENGTTINDLIVEATATIGEKITLRRFEIVTKEDGDAFGIYSHMGGKITSVAIVNPANAEIAKDMAMQVASMNPQYVSQDVMPKEIVEHERGIQMEIMKNNPADASKPDAIKEKMLAGRVSKALQDMCLLDQEFFKDTNIKVGKFLKGEGVTVKGFVRYAVGEGLEKRTENFAEEVAKASK
ncbi:MAG: translation elongation factor Ts [Erysipelotrichaceae bacterium]|nr:translation elongation factor Ts [Erysipelotrichaceae bacterium]